MSSAAVPVAPPEHHQQLISIDSSTTTSNGGDAESLQYLKPTEDAVAWSESSVASDLLF